MALWLMAVGIVCGADTKFPDGGRQQPRIGAFSGLLGDYIHVKQYNKFYWEFFCYTLTQMSTKRQS